MAGILKWSVQECRTIMINMPSPVIKRARTDGKYKQRYGNSQEASK